MERVHTTEQRDATHAHSMRNIEDCTGRLDLLSNIFTDDPTSDNTAGSYRQDMCTMEKLFLREAKTWWDLSSLRTYIEKRMIPRGLRMKKIPTTQFDNDFTTKWNNILTDCSINLMELIVSKEEEAMIQIRNDIKATQSSLQQYLGLPEMQEWDTKLKANIMKLEADIVSMKKTKFQRDLNDYKQDCVYDWGKYQKSHLNTPRSILKNQKYRKWQKVSRKVSFNSSALDESDLVMEDSNREAGAAMQLIIQPSEQMLQSKNAKASKKDARGGAAAGSERRYLTREMKKMNMD